MYHFNYNNILLSVFLTKIDQTNFENAILLRILIQVVKNRSESFSFYSNTKFTKTKFSFFFLFLGTV